MIVSDPNIHFGKPTIKGTRITVEVILDRIAAGMSLKEILEDYPSLTAKHIQTVVSYANDVVSKEKRPKSTTNQPLPIVLYTHEISG